MKYDLRGTIYDSLWGCSKSPWFEAPPLWFEAPPPLVRGSAHSCLEPEKAG